MTDRLSQDAQRRSWSIFLSIIFEQPSSRFCENVLTLIRVCHQITASPKPTDVPAFEQWTVFAMSQITASSSPTGYGIGNKLGLFQQQSHHRGLQISAKLVKTKYKSR